MLLYIELTISFLIGWKRTVNLRNQPLWRHLAADYTISMFRTLKFTGNHVMYDRDSWFLRVIMSSSRALCRLPSVNFNNFGSSGNFPKNFPYHLSPFRNFRSFWLNEKCPIFPRFLYRITSDFNWFPWDVPLQFPLFVFFVLSDQHFSCVSAAPGAHVTATGYDLPHGVEERVGWLWNTTDRASFY